MKPILYKLITISAAAILHTRAESVQLEFDVAMALKTGDDVAYVEFPGTFSTSEGRDRIDLGIGPLSKKVGAEALIREVQRVDLCLAADGDAGWVVTDGSGETGVRQFRLYVAMLLPLLGLQEATEITWVSEAESSNERLKKETAVPSTQIVTIRKSPFEWYGFCRNGEKLIAVNIDGTGMNVDPIIARVNWDDNLDPRLLVPDTPTSSIRIVVLTVRPQANAPERRLQ